MELKKYGLTLKDLQVKDIASADAIAIFADPSGRRWPPTSRRCRRR